MDSTVDAALAAKLTLLFPPTDDSYLAFPRSGAAFTLDELDLFDTGEGTAEEIRIRGHRKAQFARILNQVPHDNVVYDSAERLLWDEYERVLERSELAENVLSGRERERLGEAHDLLEDEVELEGLGTTTVYSAKLTAYYQYKEAWQDANRVYLDEKISVEASSDAGVKAAWEDGREVELADLRNRAMQDWRTLGFKNAVEEAQATIGALGGRSPEVLRMRLLADFEACVEPDLVTNDPNGVFSTFYSPSDIFDPEVPWETLHLTRDEVEALHEQAPDALRGGGTDALDEIDSVTIEYADVTVIRPWHDPSWFDLTSWRLPRDDNEIVSDGKTPRSGRIPAWISSMIVARRVVVERTEAASGGDSQTWNIPFKLDLFTRADVLRKAMKTTPSTASTGVPVGPSRVGGVKKAATPKSATLGPFRARSATPSAPVGATLARPQGDPRVLRAKLAGVTIARQAVMPTIRADLRAATVLPVVARPRPRDLSVRSRAPARRPRKPAGETQELDFDSVVVLAYRCTRVGECPRPDESLDWGQGSGVGVRAFPLQPGHVFAAKKGGKRHTGHTSAAERVHVRAIQHRLIAHGHEVDVDGYIGPNTGAAINAFKAVLGLKVDGVVGPNAWAALWEPPVRDD